MVGKIYIVSSGYDPELGDHINDPYLGSRPTLGACRPDIRAKLKVGDQVFAVSGRVGRAKQFVMGGFEIESKIHATEAYRLFPDLRLHRRNDGQITGNVIVNSEGVQHELDEHKGKTFAGRINNYLVGTNPICLSTPDEIAEGRAQTLEALCEILEKKGRSPFEVIGRFGASLNDRQVTELREWLEKLKRDSTKSAS